MAFALRGWIGMMLACGLGGCGGGALGNYQVTNVEIVDGGQLNQVEPDEFYPGGPQLVRVAFTSRTDVVAAADSGALYISADFCPLGNPDAIRAIGPLPDGRSVFVRDKGELSYRHPARDPAGLYHYTAYIDPSQGPDEPGVKRNYDLSKDHRDVCLRIFRSRFFEIWGRQSDVFTVPGAAIAEAFRRVPVVR
jgi:hypothetical protein